MEKKHFPFREAGYYIPLKKILITMKLTLLIILLSVIQMLASDVYSQSTTFSMVRKNVKIEDILNTIESNSEYYFLYNGKLVDVGQKVNINIEKGNIEKTLDTIFRNTGISYKIYDRQIVLSPSETENTASQQQKSVSGKVTDTTGSPLPGVSILIKGSEKGTITDSNGNFMLTDVSPNAVLQFSFIGMKAQEIMVNDKTKINVVLSEESIGLAEVVAVGYGSMKKSDITGSVASVNSDNFVKGVSTNALQLLSGKAPGVKISEVNSEPGGTVNISVRGAGSINSSNTVLFVIDGLPGGNPANINPADIENVEILKDASAAAIYGTRAANGVVLITTKKGKEGTPKISFSTYAAFQTPSFKFDVLDATQYMQMLNDISKDAGKSQPFTAEQIASAGKGTNWQDELMRNAWASNYQFSISGGSKQIKYYTSLGYLDQTGILISSGFKKYNFLVNLELTPSDKFRYGININGNYNFKDKIANESNAGNEFADPLNSALMFDPRLSPKKNKDGVYEVNPSIALDNPVALAYGYDYRTQNNRFYGNTFGEYSVTKDLKATLRLGADINNTRDDQYTDRTTQRGIANGGIANIQSSVVKYWLTEGILNYDKKMGEHHLSLMGGVTWEKFETLKQTSYATGFLSDATNTNFIESGNPLTFRVNSSKDVYKLQSFIARANYSYKDKYLLTTTLRRDGTSRFSDTNKYAYFPSLALGWRISEEPFLKNFPAISNLKLKAGYGQMGNEGIKNFETISTFVAGGNTVLGNAIQNGAQPARIPNQDLTWETTEEYNLGFDYGFFNNRISGTIEYYVKNSIDQLFQKPVPMTTGFPNVRTNFGTVRNSGVDFAINTANLTGKLKWNTSITLSTLKNKVVKLPPYLGDIITGGIVANIPGFALVRQGYPMQAFYGYKVIGIFQQGDDIAHSAQPNAVPGQPIFLDAYKDGKIDSNDRVILGDPFPDLTYSINNSLSYKNFNLEIYLVGVQGIQTFNANILESMLPINFDRNIMKEHYLQRWTPEHPNAKYPSGVNSSTYFANGKMINNYTVQDASYLRIKNITLSYNVPLKGNKLFKSIMLSLSGENLFTFTKYEGYDPEANQTGDGTDVAKSSYNNYPLARTYRLGASINF